MASSVPSDSTRQDDEPGERGDRQRRADADDDFHTLLRHGGQVRIAPGRVSPLSAQPETGGV
jgi:hypothetical protein